MTRRCKNFGGLKSVFVGAAVLAFAASGPAIAQVAYPLRISQDVRHLEDSNGEPFLMNGDTPWSLMVALTKAEADEYLENRRQKGFNAVIVNLIERYFKGPANRDGQQPFLTPGDLSTPNDLYFAHADWVISRAAEKGMLVVLTPAYFGYNCNHTGWCNEMKASGVDKCRSYGQYLGQRYKDFDNIIWMNGGDADAAAWGGMEEVNAIAAGIREFASQIHTAHCKRLNAGVECYNEPWLAINTTYGGTSASATECYPNPSEIRTDYSRNPTLPFFYVEGKYEGEQSTPECYRGQAYWSILGGAGGHFFGNRPIWLFDPGWQAAMDADGSRRMTHMNDLFQSRAWHDLVPDYSHTVVLTGFGDINRDSYAGAALTSDGNTLIVYVPNPRTLTVSMDAIAGEQAEAWWFNPRDGLTERIGQFPTTGTRDFTPSGVGDRVLVIDNAAAGFPPPGDATAPAEPTAPSNLRVR